MRSAWAYKQEAGQFRNAALIGQANANSMSPSRAGNASLLADAPTIADKWIKYFGEK